MNRKQEVEKKIIPRNVRRITKRVNQKMNELVNAWFKERAKLKDPDGQEAIDILNKYNIEWRKFCNKKFRDPAKYINKFIDICDAEDKKMRDYMVQKVKIDKFNKEWEVKLKILEITKATVLEITEEFNKLAKEYQIEDLVKKAEAKVKETIKK